MRNDVRPAHGSADQQQLTDYMMPVTADTPDIDVTSLDYPDYNLSALGVRASGRSGSQESPRPSPTPSITPRERVRNLPVRIEHLLEPTHGA